MDNKTWLENFYQSLEQKKEKMHPSDFRFYNIARLPILANKTLKYSDTCRACKLHIKLLEELVDELPECLNQKDTRKKFEINKNKIVSHMVNVHKLRFATYYTSLFTLIGSIAGGLLWFILTFVMISKLANISLVFVVIGMTSGYLIGKMKDKRKYRENQQI